MYNFVFPSRNKCYTTGADDSVAPSYSHHSRLCRLLCLQEMAQKGQVWIQHCEYRGRDGNGHSEPGTIVKMSELVEFNPNYPLPPLPPKRSGGLSAQPISIRKAQSRKKKKKPTYLCAPREFLRNCVCHV